MVSNWRLFSRCRDAGKRSSSDEQDHSSSKHMKSEVPGRVWHLVDGLGSFATVIAVFVMNTIR